MSFEMIEKEERVKKLKSKMEVLEWEIKNKREEIRKDKEFIDMFSDESFFGEDVGKDLSKHDRELQELLTKLRELQEEYATM